MARSASQAWCVLENWHHKQTVARVAELLASGCIGAASAYSLRFREQLRPQSGGVSEEGDWREAGSWQGGWCDTAFL